MKWFVCASVISTAFTASKRQVFNDTLYKVTCNELWDITKRTPHSLWSMSYLQWHCKAQLKLDVKKKKRKEKKAFFAPKLQSIVMTKSKSTTPTY